jgi:hypothetical protein
MRRRTKLTLVKLVLGAFVVILPLAAMAGAAAGRRIEASESLLYGLFTPLRMVSAEGSFSIACNITILATMISRTFSKVSGASIRRVGHVVVAEPCTGGRARVLAETLPWDVRFNSFTGTLPSITSIRLQVVGMALQVEVLFGTCLYATSGAHPAMFDENLNAAGEATGIRALSEFRIPSQTGFCPEARLEGTGTVVAGTERSTTRMRFRLVQ